MPAVSIFFWGEGKKLNTSRCFAMSTKLRDEKFSIPSPIRNWSLYSTELDQNLFRIGTVSCAVLDYIHPPLAPVAFIHDAKWSRSDGTKESFTASNERFKRNGYKVAKAEFSWWRPRRYLVMNDARRFGKICQALGWNGWLAPLKKAKEDTK